MTRRDILNTMIKALYNHSSQIFLLLMCVVQHCCGFSEHPCQEVAVSAAEDTYIVSHDNYEQQTYYPRCKKCPQISPEYWKEWMYDCYFFQHLRAMLASRFFRQNTRSSGSFAVNGYWRFPWLQERRPRNILLWVEMVFPKLKKNSFMAIFSAVFLF